MASQGTRYFYSRQNQTDQQETNNHEQPVSNERQVTNGPRRSNIVPRGRGRTQRDRPTFGARRQEETIDPRNTWPQMCERHMKLKKRFPDLPCFKIPNEVHEAVIAKNVKSLPLLNELNGELDPRDYRKPLSKLLEVEEAHQAIEMRKFDMKNKRVDLETHSIDFPGLSNGQPSLVTGDIVIMHDDSYTIAELFYIVTTRGDKIILNERRVSEKKDILKDPLNMTLVSSGSQFDTCRRALDKSSDNFIQDVISDAGERSNHDITRTFDLSWTKGDFEDSISNLSKDSWLKTLFSIDGAHEDLRKVYCVNPGMWPVLRGCRYDPNAELAQSYVIDTSDIQKYSQAGHVIMQSPTSLKTVILPIDTENSGSCSFCLDTQSCNDIREFFHEESHDLMFVSSSLVKEANLTDAMQPSVQPSLRDFFHDGAEDLDSKMSNRTAKIDIVATNDRELSTRLHKLNEPQRQAVMAILEARYRPRPYILFGPPGTGKTHTLVEAVIQIYLRDSRSRILFCANSNTCADQIFEKIERTGIINMNDLQRIRAGERVAGLDFVRIIVTTNIKAGSLMSSRGSFDYVLLDEAGHAHEPESLIPICSLDKYDGCLVLAGDPKQLGPVVQCQQASDLGLGRSMLERIFKYKVYDRHYPHGRYNKFYITKLLHCYRCDPAILEIPNKLFYDNELMYVNETPRSLLKIMQLKKSVQFRHVQGRESKPEWSTSWRNFEEIDVCVDILLRLYKIGFDAEQIGIITPYKLQSKEIVKRLKTVLSSNYNLLNKRFPAKWADRRKKEAADLIEDSLAKELETLKIDDKKNGGENEKNLEDAETDHKIVWSTFKREWVCKIDTVDAFQGNEREVIIISTVRTGRDKRLDFLEDARRFNVAVSRAKWLAIVVGDKDIVSGGSYWSKFYERAEKNGLSGWPPMEQASYDEGPHSYSTPLFRR